MSDEPMLGGPASGEEAEHEEALIAPAQGDSDEAPARGWFRSLQDRLERFQKSAAGRYWDHLSSADFMNSSFAFSALAVLSAFPFLAVSSAAIGGDIRTVIVSRMGLDPQATRDLDGLIATGDKAVATLTWVSAIVRSEERRVGKEWREGR